MLAFVPVSLLLSTLALSELCLARNSSSQSRALDRRRPPFHFVDASTPAALQRAFAIPVPANADLHALDPAADAPNFGAPCAFDRERAFLTCGDWLDRSSGVDHGLFCSPAGVCAGEGAVCGTSEGCGQGLECNLRVHRCHPKGSFGRSREELQLEGRRKAAGGACPVESEVCASGTGYSVSPGGIFSGFGCTELTGRRVGCAVRVHPAGRPGVRRVPRARWRRLLRNRGRPLDLMQARGVCCS